MTLLEPYKLLRTGTTVFKVLAWIALAAQAAIGLVLLIGGGEPVLIGNVDVPARVVGILNCLAAVIYFFMFMLVSAVLRLLLDVHASVRPSGTSRP